MGISWVDSPVKSGTPSIVQPDSEGGVPWDREAWLRGWRSGEEVVPDPHAV